MYILERVFFFPLGMAVTTGYLMTRTEFCNWLHEKNPTLDDASMLSLCSLVIDAHKLQLNQVSIQHRAARLGHANVNEMLKVCTPEFQTCYMCGMRDRYFEPCRKCGEVYFCSLLCKSNSLKKHKRGCKRSLKRKNRGDPSPTKK